MLQNAVQAIEMAMGSDASAGEPINVRDSNLQARLQSLLACVKRRCDGSQDLDSARPAAAEEAEERQKQLDESLKEMVRILFFILPCSRVIGAARHSRRPQ